MIIISYLSILWAFLLYILNLFLHWVSIFGAPIKEPEMFWIIIPIWINWFFTEFFIEKYGTSFGNAIGNGVIPILASVDWARYLYRGYIELSFDTFLKFALAIAVFVYGVFVIVAGIKLKHIIFYVGRIRWITYVLLMLTPIIYNVVKFDFYTLTSTILFFPLYWWVIEFFDRITPEPRVYGEG